MAFLFSTLWLYKDPAQCRYRPVEPDDKRLLAVEEAHRGDMRSLYDTLIHERRARIHYKRVPCRVQRVDSLGGTSFVLRAVHSRLGNLNSLGVHPMLREELMAPGLTGLVLVAGPQAAGKTTLASSLVVERIVTHGGVAQVIEVPEVDVEGVYGEGLIQQVDGAGLQGMPNDERLAWLAAEALRAGTDIIFLGEVRRPKEAAAVVHQAAVGALVLTTIHANNIATAVERLVSLAASTNGSQTSAAGASASAALSMVLHLTLDPVAVRGGGIEHVLRIRPLIFKSNQEAALRNAVKRQRYEELQGASNQQVARIINGRADWLR